jgi:hypothetical protein
MEPTLHHDDFLIVSPLRDPASVQVGDVVLAWFDARPGLLVVKRVERVAPAGVWLIGDNPSASDASEKYGWAQPVGRVIARYWPRPGLIRRRRRH